MQSEHAALKCVCFIAAMCVQSHHMLLGGKQRTEDFTEAIMAEIPECAENIKLGAANFTFQKKEKRKKERKPHAITLNGSKLYLSKGIGKIGTVITTRCLHVW